MEQSDIYNPKCSTVRPLPQQYGKLRVKAMIDNVEVREIKTGTTKQEKNLLNMF